MSFHQRNLLLNIYKLVLAEDLRNTCNHFQYGSLDEMVWRDM